MHLYPATVEATLGFDVLRRRLDGYTRSRLGQERLEQLRPSALRADVEAELHRVAELQQAFRFDDPVPLDHVLDLREVLHRATPAEAFVDPDDLMAVRLVLETVRRLKQYFEARKEKYPHLLRSVERITPLPDLEALIARVVDDEGRVADDASPELRRIRRTLVQRRDQLRSTLMQALRAAIGDGYATEEQPTIRSGRMVIPVRAEAKRKVSGFVHDTSASGQTVYIEPASCLDLNNEIRELESAEVREVERILRSVTSALRAELGAMRANLQALAVFDLLQAKARLTNELDAVVPHLNEEGVIDIVEGHNPVLLLHVRRHNEEHPGAPRSVVPLDLVLGEEYHTLVITGPNAGGKTVAMKTVGLLALMLAYGLPIPVDERSRFSLFERLIADVGDEQSIEEDLSTFSSHVANLKYMLEHADARTLVLMDEAGTGTDPAEGGALAQAMLEDLTRRGARTFATTHHGTLKVFAFEAEGVENGSMQFDQETLSPTYRFQAGVPGSSYAFEIAQRIGLDDAVLARARALVGEQKTALEELILTFEARNQALAEQLEEAHTALERAEQTRRTFQGQADRLNREKDEIRRQALEEAEQLLEGANARIERTIREIKEAEAAREATHEARAELEAFREDVARRHDRVKRRQKSKQKKAAPTAPQPAAAAKGPIAPGDQVVLDGGSSAAEVLEVEGQEAVITAGAMRLRVRLDRLTKVGGPRRQQVVVRQPASVDVAALQAQHRIDLRGQRVDEALHLVQRTLDRALAANLDRVEILHGKGTGALRQAIHDYLATRPDVAGFDEAPWDEGGPGVTYVLLG